MSYTIYHTEGFVLSVHNSGEANNFYYIYTKDFGLITATAQGVRLMKSKLRYSLQGLSLSDLSLVRGKGGWRIVNARVHQDHISSVITDNSKRVVFSRIIMLLRKLVNGEERDDVLYTTLYNAYQFLSAPNSTHTDFHNLEIMTVLQILHTLGYLAPPEEYLSFIESDVVTTSLLSSVDPLRDGAINVINNTLRSIDI